MSTFSRLSNLAKGLVLTRGGSSDPDAEAALEHELRSARPTPVRAARPSKAVAPAEPDPATPIELDEHGNAKRTL